MTELDAGLVRRKLAVIVRNLAHLAAVEGLSLEEYRRDRFRQKGAELVGFTQAGRVAEVSSDGAVVWEGDIQVTGVPYSAYRAIRIASLYHYQRL